MKNVLLCLGTKQTISDHASGTAHDRGAGFKSIFPFKAGQPGRERGNCRRFSDPPKVLFLGCYIRYDILSLKVERYHQGELKLILICCD